MSLVIVIVSVIVILLFLLVFTMGFFMGLGRKKKDIALLEKEQEIQKKTQESIISHFLIDKKGVDNEYNNDQSILPVKIINRSYKRIKKYLTVQKFIIDIKQIDLVQYLRKYLLAYIGIAVLVFGFGYFVKHSVTAEYTTIIGRFMITVFISALLILLSHSIHKKYKTFSSIIMGGALGSLYITFTISFYTYNIFTNFQIFAVFFLLTAISVVLSLVYNRFELLLLAIIAGFASPVLSNFDFTHIRILLIYALLLDIGAIIISAKYRNFMIRVIPAVFTGAYMIYWIQFCLQNNIYIGFETDFFILIAIYFTLIVLGVIHNVLKKIEYKPYELMIVLVINLIYYSIGMYMLNVLNPDYKGAFTALIAVFNMLFLIIILLYRKQSSEQLIYFFAIISLLFLTLIPPVELVGKSITMIWAVETVLLMWVSIKLDIKMLKLVSTFLMMGLIGSFILDVVENYFAISTNAPDRKFLINKSFISGIMTSFGLGLNVFIIGKSADKYLIKPIRMSHIRAFISVIAIGSLYISLYFEILYHLTISIKDQNLMNMYLGIFNFSFILASMIILTFIKKTFVKYICGIIAVLSTIIFFTFYLYDIISVRDHLLLTVSISMKDFINHLILISLLILIIYLAYINLAKINEQMKKISKWLITLLLMAVLITEIDHIAVIGSYGSGIPTASVLSIVHYFYYTMFCTFSALILSFSGLLFKDKELVRVSIFIIFATLFKVFAFDVSNLNTWERTFTFISVGFVLLFIAYVRQRLFEKITLDGQSVTKN